MVRVPVRVAQNTGGTVALVAGAEAVIATLSGVSTTRENAQVQLDANVPVTTVAEDTEIIIRIRRTALGGTEVAKLTTKPGASAILTATLQALDEPGEVVNQTYVLTLESVAKKASEAKAASLQAVW